MQTQKRVALYKTTTKVMEGDEFYEILLVRVNGAGSISYVVEAFHGRAGNLPTLPEKPKPESQQIFPAVEAAAHFFDNSVRLLEEKGFVQYDPHLHGQDCAFKASSLPASS